MDTPKKWIVTLSGDRPLDEVHKDLKAAGFTVHEVYDQIGSISGSAGDAVIQKLRKLPGVADISPDAEMGIGPPGKDATW